MEEIRKLSDPGKKVGPSESAYVVACLRNERPYLPAFLAHYRQLGAGPFLLVDNGSEDGSVEYLLAEDDVVLFQTTASYAESGCGIDWTNALSTRFASGHWVLTVDIDELLVYPFCETLGLRDLLADLAARGRTGLRCFLLDMYSDRPIAETVHEPDRSLLETCPFYDADTYRWERRGFRRVVPVRGGPRWRLFWDGQDVGCPPPYLAKTPLVVWNADRPYTVSTHRMPGILSGRTTGALLHFKLLSDLPASARTEARRKEHFAQARQYEAYARRFLDRPDLTAFFRGSERWEGSAQLLDQGLIRAERSLRRRVRSLGAGL